MNLCCYTNLIIYIYIYACIYLKKGCYWWKTVYRWEMTGTFWREKYIFSLEFGWMVRVTQKRQRDSISKLNGEKEHKVTRTIKAKTYEPRYTGALRGLQLYLSQEEGGQAVHLSSAAAGACGSAPYRVLRFTGSTKHAFSLFILVKIGTGLSENTRSG